jgi:predicted nucleic acid-binding protein
MSGTDANAALAIVRAFPIRAHPLASLAEGALALAIETSLSAYDCCYAVLAESLDATLLTADRRLAAAVPNAELIV